jgi:hypothetical protein
MLIWVPTFVGMTVGMCRPEPTQTATGALMWGQGS